MLPYQLNCPAFALPPARSPPVPGAVPFPLPVCVAALFFDSFASSSFTGAALAISVFSAGPSAGSVSSFSGAGLADGFGDAFAKTNFFGEGVRAGLAVGVGLGVGFGFGLGIAFGVSF